MARHIFVLLSIVVFCASNTEAIQCYACSVNAGDIDQRCVTNPGEVESGQKIVNCNKEYCTIKRVEYKDPADKVHSMVRSCEDNPAEMNTVIEDEVLITYYRACRQDLCNGGSGRGSDGEEGWQVDIGPDDVLIVKGSRAPAGVHQVSGLLGMVLAVAMAVVALVVGGRQ